MIIRTVLGDIPPESLGLTLGHDHLMTHPLADVTDADLVMDDVKAATRELESFKRAGGGALVEMTTVDYGRDALRLEWASRDSGVHVIAATGFNKGIFADRLSASRSVAEIAAWMIREVQDGVAWSMPDKLVPFEEYSRARAGLIKASSGLNGPNANELKVFGAAIEAHRATAAPIGTHTEKGTWGLEQARLFLDGGVPAHKVLIGHLDLKPELPYLLEIAASGVNLGFDQFGKEKYLPDRERVKLIVKLCEAGHDRQIILGGDMARKSYFRAYGGGPGLKHVPVTVRAMLLEAGLSLETLNTMLLENPRRWLAFQPT